MAFDRPDWSAAPVALSQPTVYVPITVHELGPNGTLYVNPSGKPLVITQIQVTVAPTAANELRGQVRLNFGWGGVPPVTITGVGAISPETPDRVIPINASAAIVPAGQDVTWASIVQPGNGASVLLVALTYYLAT